MGFSYQYLESYEQKYKVKAPEKLKELCQFFDSLSLKVFIRKNKMPTLGGCEEASFERSRNIQADSAVSMYDELKTLFLKVDDKYVMTHFRGNRELDTKKIRKIFYTKNIRFLSTEELKEFDLEKGKINPCVEATRKYFTSKYKNKEIYHIFDKDLLLKYSVQGSMTTNAFDADWMIDFNIKQLIKAFSSPLNKYYKNIQIESIVKGGPSQSLIAMNNFVNCTSGFLLYGYEAGELYEQLVRSTISKKISSLQENGVIQKDGEKKNVKIPILNAGTFTDNRFHVSMRSAYLEHAMDLYSNKEDVLEELQSLIVKCGIMGVKKVFIPCNILPFALNHEYISYIKDKLKNVLNTKEDMNMYSISDALIETLRKKITTNKKHKVLLIAGSAVTDDHWSIYIKPIHEKLGKNIELILLKKEKSIIDNIMYIINRKEYEIAQEHLYDICKNYTDCDFFIIASTSISVYFHHNGNKLLNSSLIYNNAKHYSKGIVRKLLNIPIIDTLQVYAEYSADELFK